MTVTVTIYLEKKENVLTVPNNAIKREQGKTVVTVLDNNDKMNRRTVKPVILQMVMLKFWMALVKVKKLLFNK